MIAGEMFVAMKSWVPYVPHYDPVVPDPCLGPYLIRGPRPLRLHNSMEKTEGIPLSA